MNKETVLVTGGAGFIGGHLCEKLLEEGYRVIILDSLSEQVHGPNGRIPGYLDGKVEFVQADVRDRSHVQEVVSKADLIVHLIAETGVGQSMYESSRYFDVNVTGTALLWEVIAQHRERIQKVVLASSRAVYGEGKYHCDNCGDVYPKGRSEIHLIQEEWDPICENCQEAIGAIPTSEDSQLYPTSIYGITKKTQEDITMTMGKALGVPISIVRYQNVFGPRQPLNNPYTGILSIFSSRLKSGSRVNVYEDGQESRDFVYVLDAVQGTILALARSEANFEIFNIGSGAGNTILEIANILTSRLNPSLTPEVTGQFRLGDVRHSIVDISKAKTLLGYKPQYDLKISVGYFLDWLEEMEAIDLSEQAERELSATGILK